MSKIEEINHPEHYNIGIETTDYIKSWDMNFVEGNIVKYVTRYKYKNGVKDLLKAKWYLEDLISQIENDEKSSQAYPSKDLKKSKQLLLEVSKQMSLKKSKR
tara:strand:+ start:5553 stop:5858 length:306 start_codon:yes stop_codon:yes gene_type:complete